MKVLENIEGRIDKLKHMREQALVKGKACDIEEYRYITGVLHGLTLAQHEVSEVSRIYMESDDD